MITYKVAEFNSDSGIVAVFKILSGNPGQDAAFADGLVADQDDLEHEVVVGGGGLDLSPSIVFFLRHSSGCKL